MNLKSYLGGTTAIGAATGTGTGAAFLGARFGAFFEARLASASSTAARTVSSIIATFSSLVGAFGAFGGAFGAFILDSFFGAAFFTGTRSNSSSYKCSFFGDLCFEFFHLPNIPGQWQKDAACRGALVVIGFSRELFADVRRLQGPCDFCVEPGHDLLRGSCRRELFL